MSVNNADRSIRSGIGRRVQSDDKTRGERRQWRRVLRERRRAVGPAHAARASEFIASVLRDSELWDAQHITLYVASDGELDPAAIAAAADAAGKSLYLPIIRDGAMDFAPWSPGQPLDRSHYGIAEPLCEPAVGVSFDLMLIPLVGWTRSGFRLGMGGGYYDRFLQGNAAAKNATRLGLAYECQQETALDALGESWDVPLEGVLSDQRLHWFS